jgi:uncharacterized protein with HEPN domain
MKRDYRLFIKDILEAIEDIEVFVGKMSFDSFHADKKTRSAIVRELEVIGEAAKNVPASVRSKYKELPWKDMAGMRDKISHFYFGIDYQIVWEVIRKKLPIVKPVIKKMLKELKAGEGSAK